MTSAPIGVFDSGVGGLSVLREIRRHFPHENLIFIADQGQFLPRWCSVWSGSAGWQSLSV